MSDTREDEIVQWFLTRQYCTSCGAWLPCKKARLCPQCGHDQEARIQKKSTNPRALARAAILYGSSATGYEFKEYLDELIRTYEKSLDQVEKKQILNIFLLSDLAITSIVYLVHYQDNPKHDEITAVFEELMDDYLLHAYGKEGYQEAKDRMTSMVEEYYGEAFKQENWLQGASRVLQYRAESVILGISLPGPKFALPSIHAVVNYLVHLASFVPPLKARLNKWEIR